MSMFERLMIHPIIGAIKTDSTFDADECEVYFILGGVLSELGHQINHLKSKDKLVFVHMDLIQGIKSDEAGLKYIKEVFDPTGIITTKSRLITLAKELGLFAIQRLFLLDNKNLNSGVKSVLKCQPDAVEILPGALHKVTEIVVNESKLPVITGGLIMDKEDVINSLKVGAIGVSTSDEKLWSI